MSLKDKTLNIFVTLVLVGAQLPAQAAIYAPFDFKDGKSHERSDIKSMFKSFRVERSRNPLPSLKYVDTSDVRLTMFTEVVDVLEAFAAPVFVPVTLKEPIVACATHETLTAESLPKAVVSSQCHEVIQEISTTLRPGFEKACRYTYHSERFVEDRGRGVVSRDELETLEGLIAVAGEPLSHLPFPSNVVSPDFKAKMRSIIAKVRLSKLMADLDQEARDLDRLTARMAQASGCFTKNDSQRLEVKLKGLQVENSNARQYLLELERAGRAQAELDRKTVEARHRNRTTLPFPSLTDQERQFLSMYLGGVYWRMRGGGLVDEPQGTQATRVWYHYLPMSMIGYVNGGDVGKAAGEAMYARIFQGWGQWMDMGRTPGGGDRYYDLVYMTDRGDRQIPDTAQILSDESYETADLRMGALQMGACYYFAYDRLMNYFIGADLKPPYGGFVDGATSWGELCTGAVISLGLSKSLLNGSGY